DAYALLVHAAAFGAEVGLGELATRLLQLVGGTMSLSSRNILFSILSCGSVAAIIIACGSEGSKFQDPGPVIGTFNDGSFNDDAGSGGPNLYEDDPPPQWCGPEGEEPPPIGGTKECPDDKNLPGCSCKTVGEEAPCWTGLRK